MFFYHNFYLIFSSTCCQLPAWFFSACFSLLKTHTVCFLTSILAFIHTFPFSTRQSASGLCFSACFPFKKHMPRVFRLQFSLLYTLFPSLHANQLPVCVFSLAFHPLLIIRHTQQFIYSRRTIFHEFECTLLQGAHALLLYSIIFDFLD